jgi:hypothetical protein
MELKSSISSVFLHTGKHLKPSPSIMPHTVPLLLAIDATLPLIRGTYPDTPIITLTYGSTEGPAQHIRLETFVHTVLERSKRGLGDDEGTS